MAASPDFQEEISKGLECGICISLLCNPRILRCHHWFCKSCIDEIMQFNSDGSAVITCPLKCETMTFVDTDQTANCLPIPYQLTSLLDVFENQRTRSQIHYDQLLCKYTKDCENSVSQFCSSCSCMFCNSCSVTHNKNKHYNMKDFLAVKFDTKNDKIMIVCHEHSTFANYVCCNKFVCLYCIRRQHRSHEYATVKQEADQVRNFVCGNQVSVENMEKIIENVDKSIKATNDSIDQWGDILKSALRRRKLKCMSKYLTHLNREENRLFTKYKALVEKHCQRYPEVISRDYFAHIKDKHDIQIISEKDKIKRNVFSFRSDQVIPTMQMELSESHFLHKNSLGKLTMEANAYLPISKAGNTTIKVKFAGNTDEFKNGVVNLDELQGFLEEERNSISQDSFQNSILDSDADETTQQQRRDMSICSNLDEAQSEIVVEQTSDVDDDGMNNTFENIGQQLTTTLEEVDQHFESLFQAIEDRFMLSSSGDEDEAGAGDDGDASGEDASSDEPEEENGAADDTAEVEQICRTN